MIKSNADIELLTSTKKESRELKCAPNHCLPEQCDPLYCLPATPDCFPDFNKQTIFGSKSQKIQMANNENPHEINNEDFSL